MNSSSPAPVIGAILAAGSGVRLGGETPKQFQQLAGKPLLAHSLAAFEQSESITHVVVVAPAEHLDLATQIAKEVAVTKLSAVVAGGATRSSSSMAALAEAPDEGKILIHDAARPLVPGDLIERVVAALSGGQAAAPGIAASDTMAYADDGIVTAMPDRDALRQLQTPQGFDLGTLRRAYAMAEGDPEFAATDDCGVVHRYLPEVAVRLVPGSSRNIKITTGLDLDLAERLLAQG